VVRVWGYVRVSTDEQAERHGLDAQRAAITSTAEQRGWDVQWIEDAGWSGSTLDRPGMADLLRRVRRSDVIVVSRLDRLSRSLVDFAGLMEDANRRGWSLVALDLGIDLTTPSGRLIASIMAAVAAWERDTIRERTRDGMAAAKAKGRLPGRRSRVSREIQDRLMSMAEGGATMRVMAARLNTDGLLTVTGVRWSASSVHGALRSARMERAAESAAGGGVA